MAQPGDTITVNVLRQTTAGAASTGKVAGDFSFIVNNTSLSISNLAEGSTYGYTGNQWRQYSFNVTLPSSAQQTTWAVFPVSDDDLIITDGPLSEVEANDLDSLSSSITAAVGEATTSSTLTVNSYTFVDGDTIDIDVTVPEAVLTELGAASLAALDNIYAGFKLRTTNSQAAPDETGLTSIVTDTSGNRVVNVLVGAPSGDLILGTGEFEKELVMDVSLEYTVATGDVRRKTVEQSVVRIIWQADNR